MGSTTRRRGGTAPGWGTQCSAQTMHAELRAGSNSTVLTHGSVFGQFSLSLPPSLSLSLSPSPLFLSPVFSR